MKKISNKETVSLTKKDGFYIFYNANHTIIEKDASLSKAYKKYRTLEDNIEKEFSNLDLNFNIPDKENLGNTSRLKIQRSNGPLIIFFVLFIGIASYLSMSFNPRAIVRDVTIELQGTLNSTLQSMPSMLKNALLTTQNGQARCFSCVLEEIIDGLNAGMSDDDSARLKEKVNILKKQYGFDNNEQ